MSKSKEAAIVVRAVKYSEHDKMLTLFTLNRGRISAVAKGALSPKSKIAAQTQLASVCEFVLSTATTEKMGYVVSADSVLLLSEIPKAFEKSLCAGLCCELVCLFSEEEYPDKLVFSLLYHTLKSINDSDEDYALLYALGFYLKYSALIGIGLNLSGCMKCKKQKPSYMLDFDSGGLVCAECMENSKDYPMLTSTEAKYLYMLTYADILSLKDSALPDKKSLVALIGIMDKYFSYTFGTSTKSIKLIRTL